MNAGIVGRDEELAQIDAFVALDGPRALLIEGEAGIGKTTLWRRGIDLAGERSSRVLSAAPAASEAQLAYAALRDLLGNLFVEVEAELPTPQRRALAVALLIEEPRGRPPGQAAVAAGALAALRAAAVASPVLVAIDDVQWLDGSSALALGFAARRLGDERIALLLARRAEPPEGLPLELDRAASLPIQRLRVGPLSVGALNRLIQRRLDRTFPRPILLRLHEMSAGNPFFGLELARALEPAAVIGPGEPLPVPPSLRDLVEGRLAALPPRSAEPLLAAAALAAPTLTLVRAVSPDAPSALRAAIEAGVIELQGDRIRFAHPMLASAAYSRAGLSARRKIHARYAELVDDIEDRALHLSLATDEPDSEVAGVLERAAVSARARGAPGAAADLAEQALRLTPVGQMKDVARRRIDAGGYWFDAGDAVRARTHLEQAAEAVGSGAVRADVLTRLARTYAFGADMRVAARLYRQALAEPEAEDRVRAQAEAGLAVALMRMLDDLPTATSHASAATKIAEKIGDRWLLADFLSVQALTEGLVGDARASEHMSHALHLALEEAPDVPTEYLLRGLQGPTFMDGILKIWTDDLEDARLKLAAARERALELGDESSLPLILRWASYAEWLVGDWPNALRLAERGEELALQTGQPSQQAVLTATRGLVLAHLGRSEAALEAAEDGLRLADQTGSGFGRMVATAAIGFLELSRGNATAVYEHLAPLAEKLESARVVEPGAVRFVSDLIEALILLGRLPEAELLLQRQEQRARSFDRASALAAAGRCRGLLHAARGDFRQAIASFEEALGEHDRARSPFELARTLLGLGVAQRRLKQKRAARASLEQALTIVGHLDAALWTEKAKAELARVGGRRPSGDALTPTERQLAELVAEGRSNKAAAAALSLTTKTVETKLSRIYAKLGVRSRMELAHRLGEEKATKL